MTTQGQVIGYARVSSSDQNLARQLEALGKIDRLFQEQVSGGTRKDRVGLQECLAYVRDGDTVRVASMDRLARSLTDLQQLVDEITAQGATVHFMKENQTYSTSETDSMSRLLLQILGAFAEFERNLIRERQAEGIRIAKAEGRYRGRAYALTAEQLENAREQIAAGISKTRVAAGLGVDRTTLSRGLTRLEGIDTK